LIIAHTAKSICSSLPFSVIVIVVVRPATTKVQRRLRLYWLPGFDDQTHEVEKYWQPKRQEDGMKHPFRLKLVVEQ
jgi:hypothetical protein